MGDVDRPDVVVVGGGAAGHAAVTTSRGEGFDGRVVLVHGEEGEPYSRTLVDKAILQGSLTAEQAASPVPLDVELVRGRAIGSDPARRAVVLADGRELTAAAVVLATGAVPRPGPAVDRVPALAGADGGEPRVVHSHTARDAERSRASLGPDPARRTVTVLGAGFVGSETAAWLAEVGATVHLVARSRLPLAGALGTAVARAVASRHEEHLDAHLGRRVEAVTERPGGVTVRLVGGTVSESDLAVVAHGTAPAAPGTGGGVDVDDRLAVPGAPGSFAAGAVAVHRDRRGRRFRTDHWDAAVAQGAHAARAVSRRLVGGPDLGPYVPDAGFSLVSHGAQVAGFGVAVPGATPEHRTLDGGGSLTESRVGGDSVAVTCAGPEASSVHSAPARENGRVTTERLPRVRASELVGRGWLNTGGRDSTLADSRGKIVSVDFWTFCCVNCSHVLDESRELEERHRDVSVVVGVHSPKFEHEADPAALAAAVERYEVHHPVLDDPELVTWSAYAARAWPTLVVVDPEGYVVAQMAGEGHASAIAALVEELVAEHDAKGTSHRGDGPYVAPEPSSGTSRFPAKAIESPGGNILVADAGHHALAELSPDGETLVRRIGSGERGLADGGPEDARFAEPNGSCLVPERERATYGFDVLVADTANHALRGVRLADGHVTTVAGTGDQFMVGGVENVVVPDDEGTPRFGPFDPGSTYDPRDVRLSSPWDVAWSDESAGFVVAMAGHHTLWAFDWWKLGSSAGTMNEGSEDGPGASAWFAQPSGSAVAPDGAVWVADAETSASRRVSGSGGGVAVVPEGVEVRTAVGQGSFDFGHRDGPAEQASMQHPLGVATSPDGSVVVADTYDGASRRFAPAAGDAGSVGDDTFGTRLAGEVTTSATGLAEPSGVVVQVGEGPDGEPQVHSLVVESAAHRSTRVALPASLAGEVLDGGAHRTQRPVTDIGAGPSWLDVPFVPAPGQKLDDRFGPSTESRVSATPPELSSSGEGVGVELGRDSVINPAVGEGVSHVTARAASCDVVPLGPDGEPDPDVFPACHLAQQDWGVPVRVVDRGEPGDVPSLTLPSRG
ncbi:hypothetical protein OY671_006054 [Metschnikowia pulcherrima]|nr:hypothetical protein OY671_006054 [Metschnikowia pulcherrima]